MDIVERLRSSLKAGNPYLLRNADIAEAANEIERLQSELGQTAAERNLLSDAWFAADQQMRLAREANERLRAALKQVHCPGGGWTGQPDGMEPTVENCMAAGACGCDIGDVLRACGQLTQTRD